MPAPSSPQKLRLTQFADRFRSEMVPLGSRFCYFAAALSLSEDDIREFLEEPVAALPPSIAGLLPPIQILLVPYLANPSDPVVAMEKPDGDALPQATLSGGGQGTVLAFAVKETEVADYHYRFYRAISELVAGEGGGKVPPAYTALLRHELESGAHGEVDESSWNLKSELKAGDRGKRPTKAFREYARASFVDTLTLYLHGICCDIDIEPGPRQLAGYLLRRRLRLLRDLYPPPPGYAVLPEDEKSAPASA